MRNGKLYGCLGGTFDLFTVAKVCDRVIANALHGRGYWFRDLRHKPTLLPEDVAERFEFSRKYKNKPKDTIV